MLLEAEDDWLVVWNIFFFHILGIVIPIDFHIFQGCWNHQPDDFVWEQDWLMVAGDIEDRLGIAMSVESSWEDNQSTCRDQHLSKISNAWRIRSGIHRLFASQTCCSLLGISRIFRIQYFQPDSLCICGLFQRFALQEVTQAENRSAWEDSVMVYCAETAGVETRHSPAIAAIAVQKGMVGPRPDKSALEMIRFCARHTWCLSCFGVWTRQLQLHIIFESSTVLRAFSSSKIPGDSVQVQEFSVLYHADHDGHQCISLQSFHGSWLAVSWMQGCARFSIKLHQRWLREVPTDVKDPLGSHDCFQLWVILEASWSWFSSFFLKGCVFAVDFVSTLHDDALTSWTSSGHSRGKIWKMESTATWVCRWEEGKLHRKLSPDENVQITTISNHSSRVRSEKAHSESSILRGRPGECSSEMLREELAEIRGNAEKRYCSWHKECKREDVVPTTGSAQNKCLRELSTKK